MTHVCAHMLSHFSMPNSLGPRWTVAHQVPLSMGFSRQEYWSGLSFPSPGDLHHPEVEPESIMSPVLADRFFKLAPAGKLS